MRIARQIIKQRIADRIAAFGSIPEGLQMRTKAMAKLNKDRNEGKPIRGFLNEKNEICPLPESKPTAIYPH